MPNTVPRVDTFEGELTALINKYSLENLSNTPDFILAYYLKDSLVAWQNAQARRTAWYRKQLDEKVSRAGASSEDSVEERPSQLGGLD